VPDAIASGTFYEVSEVFFNDIGKNLIYLGLILIVLGLVVHFGGKFFPFGRLPGDFHWENANFSVHFPLVTCIVISIVLTILVNLFWR